MKIPIDVEVVMEECNGCRKLEVETQDYLGVKTHRCKHYQVCRTIIELWENKKNGTDS